MIGETLNENEIECKSKISYKNYIKQRIRNAAFSYLSRKQESHSKVKDIKYEKLEIQTYFTSPLFSNTEVRLLFALRSRYIDCKANFRNKYSKDNLLCQICAKSEETQIHIFECEILKNKLKSEEILKDKAEYNDLFKDARRQKVIVTIFTKLLDIRKTILHQQQSRNPSISDEMLRNRFNLQNCIVNDSFGK